jgi:hypothetical protein
VLARDQDVLFFGGCSKRDDNIDYTLHRDLDRSPVQATSLHSDMLSHINHFPAIPAFLS